MKFGKKSKRDTEISTASLPDIVFLLLFFFMVSATIRPKEDAVSIQVPKAQSITKVDRKELIKELQIGVPKNTLLGSEPRISSNNHFMEIDNIGEWAIAERETLPEVLRDQMIVIMKVDEKVKMGMVTDIHERLREVNARKVVFRTLEEY